MVSKYADTAFQVQLCAPTRRELLQRARAVDNQCFVLTCSPARMPGASYQAWGHSTAVGPFAEIVSTCDEKPATVGIVHVGQSIDPRGWKGVLVS